MIHQTAIIPGTSVRPQVKKKEEIHEENGQMLDLLEKNSSHTSFTFEFTSCRTGQKQLITHETRTIYY